MENGGYFARLPVEILLAKVMRWLDPQDLCSLGGVCAFWRQWSGNNSLWRALCFEDYCCFEDYVTDTPEEQRDAPWFWKESYRRFYPPVKLELTFDAPTCEADRTIVVGPRPLYIGRREDTLKKAMKQVSEIQQTGGDKYPTVTSYHRVIEGDHISGVHCLIRYDKQSKRFFVTDCRSRNGTFHASPAPGGRPMKWELLGDRTSSHEHPPYHILSYGTSVKLGLAVLRVTYIAGVRPPTSERNLSREVTPLGAAPIILRVIRGPGAGSQHAISPDCSCTVGRVAQQTTSTSYVNLPSSHTSIDFGAFFIDDPAKTISRRHMEISFQAEVGSYVLTSHNHRTWVCSPPPRQRDACMKAVQQALEEEEVDGGGGVCGAGPAPNDDDDVATLAPRGGAGDAGGHSGTGMVNRPSSGSYDVCDDGCGQYGDDDDDDDDEQANARFASLDSIINMAKWEHVNAGGSNNIEVGDLIRCGRDSIAVIRKYYPPCPDTPTYTPIEMEDDFVRVLIEWESCTIWAMPTFILQGRRCARGASVAEQEASEWTVCYVGMGLEWTTCVHRGETLQVRLAVRPFGCTSPYSRPLDVLLTDADLHAAILGTAGTL